MKCVYSIIFIHALQRSLKRTHKLRKNICFTFYDSNFNKIYEKISKGISKSLKENFINFIDSKTTINFNQVNLSRKSKFAYLNNFSNCIKRIFDIMIKYINDLESRENLFLLLCRLTRLYE